MELGHLLEQNLSISDKSENEVALTLPDKPDNDTLEALIDLYSNIDPKDCSTQVNLLEKILKLDSNNSKWQLALYNVRRTQRRSSPGKERNVPSNEERLAIGKAIELDPDNIQIIIACCFSMVDFIKCHEINWKGSVCFGKHGFLGSREEIFAVIQSEARRALKLDPTSLSLNITLSDMFGADLPPNLRNIPFAKECLERAAQIYPNSSKVNRRLGAFYLMLESDLEKVEQYFVAAIKTDDPKEKFDAIVDILQSLYLKEFPEKFEGIMECELQNEAWDGKHKSRLYYLRGLYYFWKEENSKGVDSWLKGCELDEGFFDCVKFLDRDRKRYQWPELNYDNIYLALDNAHRKLRSNGEPIKFIIELRKCLDTQMHNVNLTKPACCYYSFRN